MPEEAGVRGLKFLRGALPSKDACRSSRGYVALGHMLSVSVSSCGLWFLLLHTFIGGNTWRFRGIRSGTVVFPWESRTLSLFTLSHRSWKGGDGTLLRLFQLLLVSFFEGSWRRRLTGVSQAP